MWAAGWRACRRHTWARESQLSSSAPLPSDLSLLGCLAEFLPHQRLLGREFPIVLITTIHYSPYSLITYHRVLYRGPCYSFSLPASIFVRQMQGRGFTRETPGSYLFPDVASSVKTPPNVIYNFLDESESAASGCGFRGDCSHQLSLSNDDEQNGSQPGSGLSPGARRHIRRPLGQMPRRSRTRTQEPRGVTVNQRDWSVAACVGVRFPGKPIRR